MSDEPTKYTLPESEIPTHGVNLMPDLPGPPPSPPLHPGTKEPAGPDDLSPIFPMGLILQEVSTDPEVEIPDEVREVYKRWRPTPLHRARAFERELGTSAHIYFKYEGGSPAGSHKPNSAVPQAYENRQAGIGNLVTETGAGQWGSALALACALFGLECKVYMVGSLGIAISEAVEVAAGSDANYALGSVLNHVLLHQTVIGQEALAQMEQAGAFPDVVIGCVGGGSNFAGLAFPFLREKIAGRDIDVLACEPAACPTLTRGLFAYDFGDTSKLTPLVPMHTLGHDFIPAPIHAGGLRYHGVAPLISQLVRDDLIRAEAYLQNDVFGSAVEFARHEGIIPAPEASHAIHGAILFARAADEAGEERTILFNLSGHGHFDMGAYDNYFAGKLEDVALDEAEIERALAAIEGLPSPA
jgi:tryptophan synthase beta chain